MRTLKSSEIEWIGEIPSSWIVHPVYYFFAERKNKNKKGTETNLLSLSYGKVIRKDINTNEGLLPESFNTYNIVEANDIIIRPTDLQNDKRSLRTGLVREHGIITSAYIDLKPKEFEDTRYFHYLLHSYDIMKVFYNMGNGVRQGLNYSEFSRLIIFAPSITEQKAIADFLDKKCIEIDSLTSDIQKQIDTLEQYKKSTITEAVTKGLNPDVTMTDSGFGYLGNVPSHWKTDKIKYHLRFRAEKNRPNAEVLSLYRELGVIPKNSRDDNHNVTSEDTSNYRFVRCGDFVVNKMKAWQGSAAVSKYEGIVSPAYFVYEFTDNEFEKTYFHYLIRNKNYTTEFMRMSGGIRVGQWDLPRLALENTIILIPPMEEQKKIADYLDKKLTEIDAVISDKKEELSMLDSYKKSLIYEYVTGKKEV